MSRKREREVPLLECIHGPNVVPYEVYEAFAKKYVSFDVYKPVTSYRKYWAHDPRLLLHVLAKRIVNRVKALGLDDKPLVARFLHDMEAPDPVARLDAFEDIDDAVEYYEKIKRWSLVHVEMPAEIVRAQQRASALETLQRALAEYPRTGPVAVIWSGDKPYIVDMPVAGAGSFITWSPSDSPYKRKPDDPVDVVVALQNFEKGRIVRLGTKTLFQPEGDDDLYLFEESDDRLAWPSIVETQCLVQVASAALM